MIRLAGDGSQEKANAGGIWNPNSYVATWLRKMMKCGCGGCGALQNPRPNAWNVARTHDREKDIGADWGK